MTTSPTNAVSPAALTGSRFLDIEHATVATFTREAVGNATTDKDKARRLFTAVRDAIRYDPYTVSNDPEHYRASHVIESGRGYCVPRPSCSPPHFAPPGSQRGSASPTSVTTSNGHPT